MTEALPMPDAAAPLRPAWRRFASASPALATGGALLLLTSALLLVPMALDDRQWQGTSTWLKPWKFHVSIALQWLTLALFAHAVSDAGRRGLVFRAMVATALASGAFEAVYITAMAAANRGSHFNVATPLLATMYALMGVGAVLLIGAQALLGWQIARRPRPGLAPALRVGLPLALALGWLLGTWTGFVVGAGPNHWVGAPPTDAGGLPLFGWSRQGGDRRVAHFFAVHATQAIGAVAWLATRRGATPSAQRVSIGIVAAFAVGWTLLVVALHRQAAAGLPLWPA